MLRVVSGSGVKIIDTKHLIATRQQLLTQVRIDKAGPARDENAAAATSINNRKIAIFKYALRNSEDAETIILGNVARTHQS